MRELVEPTYKKVKRKQPQNQGRGKGKVHKKRLSVALRCGVDHPSQEQRVEHARTAVDNVEGDKRDEFAPDGTYAPAKPLERCATHDAPHGFVRKGSCAPHV